MGVRTIGGRKIEKVLKTLKQTPSFTMQVGYFPWMRYEADASRGQKSSALPVAQVAFWNEYGTSKHSSFIGSHSKSTVNVSGIPERAFLRTSNIHSIKSLKIMLKGLNVGVTGIIYSDLQIKNIGNMWTDNIKKSIKGQFGTWKPNSIQTIEGKGSSTPLIDTGRMLFSPRYIVKSKVVSPGARSVVSGTRPRP